MATRRVYGWGSVNYYHVVSRVVDRRFIFGEAEKAFFRATLEKLCGFTGVECVTYCVMSNHFHLVLKVPDAEVFWAGRGGVDDAEVIRRIGFLYRKNEVARVRGLVEKLRATSPVAADELIGRYVRRMHDLSVFVKELKWRFSRWYNSRSNRLGTLWERPFHSVLVEPGSALLTVAAYVDLNPVRAGIVSDPGDYRWCGYAEASAGKSKARKGIMTIFATLCEGEGGPSRRSIGERYRAVLFSDRSGNPGRPASQRSVARIGKRKEGERGYPTPKVRGITAVSAFEALRYRVRYFTAGWALGTKVFVEEVFRRNRERFGLRRTSGARLMRFADWGGLATLRDLKVDVVSKPG